MNLQTPNNPSQRARSHAQMNGADCGSAEINRRRTRSSSVRNPG
jgi:hypothetical protein